MTAVPELRGDRIVLNAYTDNEAAAHAAGEDEETARRFGWWPAHSTEQTVQAAYTNWARNWQDDGPVRAFAARDPGSGALVGGCELRIGPDGTGEVSYWTHAGQRGQGHARNALALLVRYAASIGITRLHAHIAPGNHASRRVAEAADFTQAGTVTDHDGTRMIRYTRPASGGRADNVTKIKARSQNSRTKSLGESPADSPGAAGTVVTGFGPVPGLRQRRGPTWGHRLRTGRIAMPMTVVSRMAARAVTSAALAADSLSLTMTAAGACASPAACGGGPPRSWHP